MDEATPTLEYTEMSKWKKKWNKNIQREAFDDPSR